MGKRFANILHNRAGTLSENEVDHLVTFIYEQLLHPTKQANNSLEFMIREVEEDVQDVEEDLQELEGGQTHPSGDGTGSKSHSSASAQLGKKCVDVEAFSASCNSIDRLDF